MSQLRKAFTSPSRRWLWLLVILAIATILRLWRLSDLPPGLYHDEAYNGLDALSILDREQFPRFYEAWELYAQDAHKGNPPSFTQWPIFFEGNYGREPLHVYLMALSISIFETTPNALRAVPAVAGILGVITTYMAASVLTKDRMKSDAAVNKAIDPFTIPILGAFFQAILFPAVHFSRFGIRAMLLVPLMSLSVYFFWNGLNSELTTSQSNRRLWLLRVNFALAGFFLGAGIYTYAASRLFPLVYALFVPAMFWLDRKTIKRYWSHLVIMAVAAILTVVPIFLFFMRYPYYLVFRIAYVANKGAGVVEGRPWLTWLLNGGRVFLGLLAKGETHLRHNLPGRPYLDPIQAGAFVAGTLVAIRERSQPRTIFLLLWFVIMLLPSVFSGDAPHFGRLVGIGPPISIMMAIGFVWFSDSLFGRLSGLAATLSRVVLFLLLVASAIITFRDYFIRYAEHPRLAADFYQPDWQLGKFLSDLPEDSTLYLSPPQAEMATIFYAIGNAFDQRLANFSAKGSAIPLGFAEQPSVYILRDGTSDLANFMNKEVGARQMDLEDRDFVALLRESDAMDLTGYNALDAPFEDEMLLIGWSSDQAEGVLEVILIWQATRDVQRRYTAYLHLLDDEGNIIAQVDREPNGYPTSDWRAGEIVMDKFLIILPEAGIVDNLQLTTGFYYLPTLESLGEPVILTKSLSFLDR